MKHSSPRYPTFVIYEGYDKKLALDSVGPGWASLIEELFSFMEQRKVDCKIIQVKEKWGGLRVYTDGLDETLDEKIQELEKRSFTICEVSGAPGKLRNCNGWYRTLSDVHGKDYPIVSDEEDVQ